MRKTRNRRNSRTSKKRAKKIKKTRSQKKKTLRKKKLKKPLKMNSLNKLNMLLKMPISSVVPTMKSSVMNPRWRDRWRCTSQASGLEGRRAKEREEETKTPVARELRPEARKVQANGAPAKSLEIETAGAPSLAHTFARPTRSLRRDPDVR